jgi:hypothetical protein
MTPVVAFQRCLTCDDSCRAMDVVASRGYSNVMHTALSTLPGAAKEDIVRVLTRHRRGKLAWLGLATITL